MDILKEVTQGLLDGKNMCLVGTSNSGKTKFIKEKLIPELEKNGKKVAYFKDGPSIKDQDADIYIYDEVETFCDRERLEGKYPDDKPYYLDKYDKKVKSWFWEYKKHDQGCLYVVTRKDEEDVEYLAEHFKWADWDDRKLITLVFK